MREDSRSTPLPDDVKTAIREMKQQLRQQIGDVDALFRQVCDNITAAIAEAKADEKRTGSAWPVVPMQDIAAGKVSDETRALIKRRGCVVIKQHFAREQALAWDKSMLDYLDHNRFDEHYRGPGDDFFGSLAASRPEIYPIYWSQAQMQARQSAAMADAQSFLNRLWKSESQGKQWFDPDVSVIYPDRIRRRLPAPPRRD